MTANGPDTLAAYYQSMAIAEGKIAEQAEAICKLKIEFAKATELLDGYRADRRELERLIAAKKKRPAKAAGGTA